MYLKIFYFLFLQTSGGKKTGKEKRGEYFGTVIYKDAKAYMAVNDFKLTQTHSSSQEELDSV